MLSSSANTPGIFTCRERKVLRNSAANLTTVTSCDVVGSNQSVNQASEIKNLLVLAHRDPIKAMRVAAGLTIHDHQVQILFLCEADLGTEEAKEYLELL